MSQKQDVLRELYQEILPLQGYKAPAPGQPIDLGLGPLQAGFPNGVFPTGAMHDFITVDDEQLAATTAFLAGVLGQMMKSGGIAVWISPGGRTFAQGFAYYGVDPDRIIFVTPGTLKKALWVVDESLRCDRFIAVVAEIPDLSSFQSRRLQLVVEQSRVTGFLVRHQPRQRSSVASIAQWRVTAHPTQSQGARPGRGFPRWLVEVLRIRNRQPMACEVEWIGTRFHPITMNEQAHIPNERKIG